MCLKPRNSCLEFGGALLFKDSVADIALLSAFDSGCNGGPGLGHGIPPNLGRLDGEIDFLGFPLAFRGVVYFPEYRERWCEGP